jgi:hypothetical protein
MQNLPTYEFTLTFRLANVSDPKSVVQHLYHTTCHDALICILDNQHIEISFERHAPSLSLAKEHAIANVFECVPYASLVG